MLFGGLQFYVYYVANLINRRSEQNNNSKKERIKPKNRYFGHAHPPTHTSTHRRTDACTSGYVGTGKGEK